MQKEGERAESSPSNPDRLTSARGRLQSLLDALQLPLLSLLLEALFFSHIIFFCYKSP